MTGQVADVFRVNGDEYTLVGVDGQGLYTAASFGIATKMASTACWRGYQMFYDCLDGELRLVQMNVNTNNAIPINDIEPRKGDFMFNSIYENLGLKTKFTGTLLLGKDFIDSMYVHMGFQSAESFQTVVEITVENGDIIKETDLSSIMDARRKHGNVKPPAPPTMDDENVKAWISKRFSQDYKS